MVEPLLPPRRWIPSYKLIVFLFVFLISYLSWTVGKTTYAFELNHTKDTTIALLYGFGAGIIFAVVMWFFVKFVALDRVKYSIERSKQILDEVYSRQDQMLKQQEQARIEQEKQQKL